MLILVPILLLWCYDVTACCCRAFIFCRALRRSQKASRMAICRGRNLLRRVRGLDDSIDDCSRESADQTASIHGKLGEEQRSSGSASIASILTPDTKMRMTRTPPITSSLALLSLPPFAEDLRDRAPSGDVDILAGRSESPSSPSRSRQCLQGYSWKPLPSQAPLSMVPEETVATDRSAARLVPGTTSNFSQWLHQQEVVNNARKLPFEEFLLVQEQRVAEFATFMENSPKPVPLPNVTVSPEEILARQSSGAAGLPRAFSPPRPQERAPQLMLANTAATVMPRPSSPLRGFSPHRGASPAASRSSSPLNHSRASVGFESVIPLVGSALPSTVLATAPGSTALSQDCQAPENLSSTGSSYATTQLQSLGQVMSARTAAASATPASTPRFLVGSPRRPPSPLGAMRMLGPARSASGPGSARSLSPTRSVRDVPLEPMALDVTVKMSGPQAQLSASHEQVTAVQANMEAVVRHRSSSPVQQTRQRRWGTLGSSSYSQRSTEPPKSAEASTEGETFGTGAANLSDSLGNMAPTPFNTPLGRSSHSSSGFGPRLTASPEAVSSVPAVSACGPVVWPAASAQPDSLDLTVAPGSLHQLLFDASPGSMQNARLAVGSQARAKSSQMSPQMNFEASTAGSPAMTGGSPAMTTSNSGWDSATTSVELPASFVARRPPGAATADALKEAVSDALDKVPAASSGSLTMAELLVRKEGSKKQAALAANLKLKETLAKLHGRRPSDMSESERVSVASSITVGPRGSPLRNNRAIATTNGAHSFSASAPPVASWPTAGEM